MILASVRRSIVPLRNADDYQHRYPPLFLVNLPVPGIPRVRRNRSSAASAVPHQSTLAVSYTHLTLPTICSV
eukprot:14840552-Alexandrium_andersonii.AAC.1